MRGEAVRKAQPEVLQKSLGEFLVFEQRNLWKPERFRSPNGDVQFDSRYLPENAGIFGLPCFWVERRHFYVYGSHVNFGAGPMVTKGDEPDSEVLFPIHPLELDRCAQFLERVRAKDATREGIHLLATPTSSTRTLLVWQAGHPEGAGFIKVSLHTPLFGDRRLQRRKVASSVGMSSLVDSRGGVLPVGVGYFPEPLGLVPRVMPDGGVIFRSIPEEIKSGTVVAAPLFALMGGSEGYQPLLMKLMGAHGVNVRDFVEEVLLAKFASIWVDLVFGSGLLLEAHAQDLLLALSSDGIALGSFYYRDFEGLSVDWAMRRARGLPEPASLPHSCEWFCTYDTWGYPLYQLVSWKMRTSLFDYLYFVLAELESAIVEWRASGVMAGPKLWEGELTLRFSRYLRKAIQERFGMREEHEYDIHKNLNRFVKFLMLVRREVMRAGAGFGESRHPAIA